MVQMSGGNFEMDYDQESTYWKANCLAHDVYDIFSMMTDCALEPRSVSAANVTFLYVIFRLIISVIDWNG